MKIALFAFPLLLLFVGGTFLARRWVVGHHERKQKVPKVFRVVSLVAVCWIGTFLASNFSHHLGTWISRGVAFDEGAELPYEIMHDGVGDRVINVTLGWTVGLICWGLAYQFAGSGQKKTIGSNPDLTKGE